MEKGLKNGKMCPVLKTEQKSCSSPRQAVVPNQLECGDSDTESLAQERAYHQKLQMCVGHQDQNKYTALQQENTDSFQQGAREHDCANDDEELQVYDSLEVASNPHGKKKPTAQTEYLDTQIDERGGSWPLCDDAYSDLRYDPNWRSNLKANVHFTENPDISVEEYHQVPEENSSQSNGDIKGGYRYIADTNPAVMLTPHITAYESDQPYCLHPQNSETSSVTSTPCHYHASPETELHTHCHQQPACTQGASLQKTSTPLLTSPEVLMNKNSERPIEDIVERNKITLGRNTSKCGSYVRAHSQKQEMPYNMNEVHETLKDTATAENHEDSSDSELRWLQRTQQLRVTRISKGKKAQRKGYPILSRQQPPPALAVRLEQGDCLSSALARPAVVTKSKPQKTTSSQPLPHTIHLNISLNTSPHLLSLLQQKGQEAIINLASLHDRPHWSPSSEVQMTLYPGYQQTNPGKASHISLEGRNAQLHHRNLESHPEQWERMTASQWPLSCEAPEDQTWSLNEVHTKRLSETLLRTPTTASSQGLGSCTVLPPIGKTMTGKEPKISPSQSVKVGPIHGSSSDSYLVQMEKQKQLRARVTNKAYKQLKTDTNLRGLCPDYTAIEKTAEKMKRQKLYSNVIREQNKKISRIPFLPAKDPEGSDKKVPRMKALEYAKTIARPPVQSQPKQRQKQPSEGLTELPPHFQDLDVAQLTRLELLRKRHEEEKQAVSLFRNVHAV